MLRSTRHLSRLCRSFASLSATQVVNRVPSTRRTLGVILATSGAAAVFGFTYAMNESDRPVSPSQLQRILINALRGNIQSINIRTNNSESQLNLVIRWQDNTLGPSPSPLQSLAYSLVDNCKAIQLSISSSSPTLVKLTSPQHPITLTLSHNPNDSTLTLTFTRNQPNFLEPDVVCLTQLAQLVAPKSQSPHAVFSQQFDPFFDLMGDTRFRDFGFELFDRLGAELGSFDEALERGRGSEAQVHRNPKQAASNMRCLPTPLTSLKFFLSFFEFEMLVSL